MKAKCYDKTFRYVPALQTDIRKTFELERQRIKAEAKPAKAVTSILAGGLSKAANLKG